MNLLQVQRDIDSIGSPTIFSINGFGIHSSTLAIFLIIASLITFYTFFIRKFSLKPNFLQSSVEMVFESIDSLLFQLTSNRRKVKDLFSIIGAIFIFILLSNLMGNIPVIGNITFNGKPIFRSPTADFNTTFALALGALIIIQLASIKDYGFFGYIGRFIKIKELFGGFKKGLQSGFIGVIDFFLGFLDIISEFAKVVSLSLRLFGNMYAGLVLLTVMTGLFAFVLPAAFVALGLLIAVVQAVVFAALITAYYMLSIRAQDNK